MSAPPVPPGPEPEPAPEPPVPAPAPSVANRFSDGLKCLWHVVKCVFSFFRNICIVAVQDEELEALHVGDMKTALKFRRLRVCVFIVLTHIKNGFGGIVVTSGFLIIDVELVKIILGGYHHPIILGFAALFFVCHSVLIYLAHKVEKYTDSLIGDYAFGRVVAVVRDEYGQILTTPDRKRRVAERSYREQLLEEAKALGQKEWELSLLDLCRVWGLRAWEEGGRSEHAMKTMKELRDVQELEYEEYVHDPATEVVERRLHNRPRAR